MKKVLILALAVFSMTAFAATPGKKDKKQKNAPVAEQTAAPRLISPSDSISYAAGMYTTRGLMDYVRQQFGVDSTNMDSFVAGLKEGIAMQKDKKFAARAAGMQIAQMLETRIYPNVKKDVDGTAFTLDSLTFNSGFVAAVVGDTTLMRHEAASTYFQSTMQAERKRVEEAYRAENAAWLKQNATKPGVVTLPSGLQYKVITAGTGEVAGKEDNVTVRYAGHTIDGKEFDSSYKRNPDTSTFRPDQVVKGWTEALTMMPVGSKWELYIPQELGYGSRPAGQIKPYSTLVFTVEVVKVEKAEKKAEAKEDTKAAPAAKKTTAKKATRRK